MDAAQRRRNSDKPVAEPVRDASSCNRAADKQLEVRSGTGATRKLMHDADTVARATARAPSSRGARDAARNLNARAPEGRRLVGQGLRGGIGMFCRACAALSHDGARGRGAVSPARAWGAERISGLRCGGCGALLGAEDIAQLLLAKELQLAQFGLVSPGRPPRKAVPPEDG
jgi:hypothetical protein